MYINFELVFFFNRYFDCKLEGFFVRGVRGFIGFGRFFVRFILINRNFLEVLFVSFKGRGILYDLNVFDGVLRLIILIKI